MKVKKDELTRQAYIDEQLSVEEIIAFEQGLSRTGKIEIEKEKQFEQALVAKLADDVECPEELWNGIRARIALQSNSWFTILHFKMLRIKFFAAAALFMAIIAAAALVIIPIRYDQLEKPSVLFSDNLTEFSRPAMLVGNYENVRNSLLKNGFTLDFNKPPNESIHKIELLGLRYLTIDRKNVAQLYFSCCARPVTVFIERKGVNWIHNDLQVENSYKTLFKANHELDNHHIFILGPHPPSDILGLFS